MFSGKSDQKGTVIGGVSADGDFFSYKVLLFAKVKILDFFWTKQMGQKVSKVLARRTSTKQIMAVVIHLNLNYIYWFWSDVAFGMN